MPIAGSARAIPEFVRSANQIDHAADQLVRVANELKHVVNQLNRVANQLNRVVNQLKYDANQLNRVVNQSKHFANQLKFIEFKHPIAGILAIHHAQGQPLAKFWPISARFRPPGGRPKTLLVRSPRTATRRLANRRND